METALSHHAEARQTREGAAIVRGMSAALLGSLLGGGFGFLFLVIMARLLEQTDFGLLILAVNLLVTVATLSIAATDSATIYYVATSDAPGNKRGVIAAALKIVLTLNVSIALLTALFAEQISTHILGEPLFTDVLRALALVLPLTVLAQMFSAALSGLELTRGEFTRKVVEQLGRILLGPLALVTVGGLVAVVFGMAVAAAASAAGVGYLLLRALPRGGKTERMRTGTILAFSWPQAIANGARQSWVLTNIVILTHFTDARTVALFGAAYAVSRLPLLIYNAFSFRFAPAIARLWAQGDYVSLAATLKNVTRWVAIFALPFYALAIAAPAPLLEVYGPEYRQAATALAIMTTATLLNSLAGPVERALIMSGRVRLEMTANLVTVPIMVILALFLTPALGLTGAALSALAYTVILNLLKVYLVWRTMQMFPLSYSLLGPLAAAVVPSILVAFLAERTALGSSIAGAVALGVLLIVLYGILLTRFVGISRADRQVLKLARRSSQ
jgi:O-antigen/teichoic acid export membrane protein